LTRLDDLADIITAETGFAVYRGAIPDVSTCVALTEPIAGPAPDVVGRSFDHPTYAITCRSDDIVTAETASYDIRKAIHRMRHQGAFVSILCDVPTYERYAKGPKARHQFTFNIRTTVIRRF
jgi:isocitrate/isopropylmalate dehydrogenase